MSQSSPFKIAGFWRVAGPGKTLCLLDGTYTGADSQITPPLRLSGTEGHPITIRALNDGRVLIDTQYRQYNGPYWSGAIVLHENSWFVIEGMNAAHGGVGVGDGANHNIIRRVVAWDSTDKACVQNGGVFGVYNNSDNLFEDVAGWGCGRKTFGRYNDTNATFRRCFALKYRQSNDGIGGGMTISTAYKSINPITENCIVAQDLLPESVPETDVYIMSPDHYVAGGGQTGCAGYEHMVTQTTVKGSIAYRTDAQHTSPSLRGMITPLLAPWNLAYNMQVTSYWDDILSLRRNSAVPPGGAGVWTGTQSVKADPPCGFGGTVIGVGKYYTDSVGTVQGGTNTTDGGNKSLGQFAGGDLLQLNATSRPTFGAWLRYRYENGNLTNVPLWPWPMNDRIKKAMVQSGYDKRGGLDGKGETDVTKLIFELAGARNSQGGNNTAQ